MDTFLWILSKVLWHLVMPDKLLVLLLLIGTGLLWTRRQKLGRALVAGVTVVLVGVTVFPVGNWLVWTLEDRFPPVPEEALPARADGILVLGGAEEPRVAATRSQPALTGAAERLTAFVFLAQRYPQARLIFAGGSGALDEQDYKAADTARWVLTRLGMDPKRVLFENQSRNTLENAQYSYELAQPEP
ncbi:MAG: YdcF family protein, partial [Nitrospinaceae bacterium]|nr:YdcF family protein [Nitrospinaceae bacterium]NIS84844.1 YdcF family protein [Nitrospinaceae bacterium]